jgi:YggT family protein
MGDLLCLVGQAYLVIIFVRIVLSWFPLASGSMMASVYSFLFSITEPVLGPVRRLLPPIAVGGMGLDLSPIVVIVGVQILLSIVCN